MAMFNSYVSLPEGIFHNIWDVILPIDFHIVQDGYCTTNQPLDLHEITMICRSFSTYPTPKNRSGRAMETPCGATSLAPHRHRQGEG